MTSTAATQFFGKTYDETSALLVAARDYLSYATPGAAAELTPVQRLTVNCESMRLVARLTQIMAWLLAQKAAHAGEISAAEAAGEKYRLSGGETCLVETDPQQVPRRLAELLEASRRLYVRVSRLDEMVQRAAADQA